MYKYDGHTRSPNFEEIEVGTVLRRVDEESVGKNVSMEAVSPFSDCVVIGIEKDKRVLVGSISKETTWVELARPYLYADTIGVCPNFLMGVERFKVTLAQVLDAYRVVLMSRGNVAEMNNRT